MIELSHKRMEVWQSSVNLVKEIYFLTQNFPQSEIYGLTAQLRRAAVSIPANLSEGLSRNSQKEKSRYLDIARSSLVELDTLLEVAVSLQFCDPNSLNEISKLSNSVFAMLTKLLKNYR